MICLTRRASPLFLIPLMPPSKYVSFSIRLRSWTKPFLCRPSLTSFRSSTGIFISTSIIFRIPPPFRRALIRQAESIRFTRMPPGRVFFSSAPHHKKAGPAPAFPALNFTFHERCCSHSAFASYSCRSAALSSVRNLRGLMSKFPAALLIHSAPLTDTRKLQP